MTREEANYYLKSSGFSDEQIETVAKAYTEPKTGHWIETWLSFWCSECKTQFGGAYKFCPNCGAKMESEGTQHADR